MIIRAAADYDRCNLRGYTATYYISGSATTMTAIVIFIHNSTYPFYIYENTFLLILPSLRFIDFMLPKSIVHTHECHWAFASSLNRIDPTILLQNLLYLMFLFFKPVPALDI